MNNMPLLRIAWRFDLVRLKDSMSDINTNTAMLDSITVVLSSGLQFEAASCRIHAKSVMQRAGEGEEIQFLLPPLSGS